MPAASAPVRPELLLPVTVWHAHPDGAAPPPESGGTHVWLPLSHSLGNAQSTMELHVVLHVEPSHLNGAQSVLVPLGARTV